MKNPLKGCDWVGHKTFTSKNFYRNLYHKNLPKTHIFLVENTLEHIPNLGIHADGIRRVFYPPILEEDLNLVDVTSVKTSGYMISFLGILFKIN